MEARFKMVFKELRGGLSPFTVCLNELFNVPVYFKHGTMVAECLFRGLLVEAFFLCSYSPLHANLIKSICLARTAN